MRKTSWVVYLHVVGDCTLYVVNINNVWSVSSRRSTALRRVMSQRACAGEKSTCKTTDEHSVSLDTVLSIGSSRAAQVRPSPANPNRIQGELQKTRNMKKESPLDKLKKDLEGKVKAQDAGPQVQMYETTQLQEAVLVDDIIDFIDSIPIQFANDSGNGVVNLVCYMATCELMTQIGVVSEDLNNEFKEACKGYFAYVGYETDSISSMVSMTMDFEAKFSMEQRQAMLREVYQVTDVTTWLSGYITEIKEVVDAFKARDYKKLGIIAAKLFIFNFAIPKAFDAGPTRILQGMGIQTEVFKGLNAAASGVPNTMSGVLSQIVSPGQDSSMMKEALHLIFGRAFELPKAFWNYKSPSAAATVGSNMRFKARLGLVPRSVAFKQKAGWTSGQWIAALGWSADFAVGPVGRMLAYIAFVSVYGIYRCASDNRESIEKFLASNTPKYMKYVSNEIMKVEVSRHPDNKPSEPDPNDFDQDEYFDALQEFKRAMEDYNKEMKPYNKTKQTLKDKLIVFNDDYNKEYMQLKKLFKVKINAPSPEDGSVETSTGLRNEKTVRGAMLNPFKYYRHMNTNWKQITASQENFKKLFERLDKFLETYPLTPEVLSNLESLGKTAVQRAKARLAEDGEDEQYAFEVD